MLNKTTAQLVEEVMGHFSEKARKKAKEDPEACLISMLTLIRNELPEVSATLYSTIGLATCDGYLQEAREKMKQDK